MNIRHLILAAAGKNVWTDPLDITADIFALPAGAVDGQMYTVVKANTDEGVGTGAVTVTSCGKNLLDKSATIPNKFLNNSGAIMDSAISSISDYVKVFPSTNYTINFGSVESYYAVACFYDSNKVFLSSSVQGGTMYTMTITTPAMATFVRFHYKTDNDCQLELGSTATAYEPYKYSKATLPAVGHRLGEVYDEINIPEGLHIQRINGDAVLETPITTPISIPIETNGIADSVLRAWKNGTVSVEYAGALPTISYSYPTLSE